MRFDFLAKKDEDEDEEEKRTLYSFSFDHLKAKHTQNKCEWLVTIDWGKNVCNGRTWPLAVNSVTSESQMRKVGVKE